MTLYQQNIQLPDLFFESSCQKCDTCSIISQRTICTSCMVGHQLVEDTCVKCGTNCIKCHGGTCIQCAPGSFFNQLNNTCSGCRKGCKLCTSHDVCTQFQSGVVRFLGNPLSCSAGCKTCLSNMTCIECNQRYYLQTETGECRLCKYGCQTCTNATSCTSLITNYVAVNSTNNVRCISNCSICLNSSSCQVCKTEFNLKPLNGTLACLSQCLEGCSQCTPSNSNICTRCTIGHALTQTGECIKCVSTCSGTCDPKNITNCLFCYEGFYLANNECQRCPIGCSKCVNNFCYECLPGYKLGSNSGGQVVCLEICRAPCLVCQFGICLVCQFGFSLINNTCVADIICNPKCDVCLIGTYKPDQFQPSCSPCLKNCSSCNWASMCFDCLDGFFLSGIKCQACEPQCLTCTNSSSCIECSPGYIKQISSMTWEIADAVFTDNCIRCNQNCKTCAVQVHRCTSCLQGYRLKGYKCSSIYTVGYQYEVNIPYSTFISNMQSQNLLRAISDSTQTNLTDNFIDRIYEGSTIVVGSLSTGTLDQAQQVQSSLGNAIQGYTVLSSSSSVMVADTPYVAPANTPSSQNNQETSSNANAGLIAGLVVGITVIITTVAILVYILKFRNKSTKVIVDKQDTSKIQLGK